MKTSGSSRSAAPDILRRIVASKRRESATVRRIVPHEQIHALACSTRTPVVSMRF